MDSLVNSLHNPLNRSRATSLETPQTPGVGYARVCIQQHHVSPAAPAGVVEECR